MKSNRLLRVVKMVLIGILAIFIFGFVTMNLWNWLVPAIFGLKAITFWQALGLLILGKILFGGIHSHGRRPGWKRHMEARFAQMTPEEREQFRAGMGNRFGCRPGRREAPAAEPTSL